MSFEPAQLAEALLPWFDVHGRHDLPWQADPTPYRVWVSEVMLQQTQVDTVKPYFERFIARFPDPRDARGGAGGRGACSHCAGLGYYARARNLHRAAAEIVADIAGVFRRRFDERSRWQASAARPRVQSSRWPSGSTTRSSTATSKRVLARVFADRGAARLQRGTAQRSGTSRTRRRPPSASRTTRRPSWISVRPSARAHGRAAADARWSEAARRWRPGAPPNCRSRSGARRGGSAARISCSRSRAAGCCSRAARRTASGAGCGRRPNFPMRPPRNPSWRPDSGRTRGRSVCQRSGTRSRISTSRSSPGCSISTRRRVSRRRAMPAGTNLRRWRRSDCPRPWQDCSRR